MAEMRAKLDSFTQAYITAALWSSTDDADEPLDKNYSADDLAEETLAAIVSDCRQFQARHGHLFTEENCSYRQCSVDEYAGHDFWFTREGHGCGFWDGDWTEPAATTLTEGSKAFKQAYLYVGDDGKLYM